MKRFLLIMASFFSFQSMTCYADPYPTIHFYYSLVLNEDLFAQADENMKIITSADYIHSFDLSIQFLVNSFAQLTEDEKPSAQPLMQSLIKCGLIKGSTSYAPAYRGQTTLKSIIYGLMSDQGMRERIRDELRELIIIFQSELPFSVARVETIDDDISTMMSLYNYLVQLSFNPQLINDSDYLNNLYQAFSKAEPSLNGCVNDLVLFNCDLIAADLYTAGFIVFPDFQLTANFQNSSNLQPLMLSLMTDMNQLFFQHMINHLLIGINTMIEKKS